MEYVGMSPSEPSLIQKFSASIQNMVQGLFAITPAFII